MAKIPNSDNGEANSSDRLELDLSNQPKRWRRIVLTIFVILLAVTGGSFAYGWFFLQRKLVPLVEKEVTDYLNRPIIIGGIKNIHWDGIRLGESEIPATQTDADRVRSTAVDVNFSFRELIFQRHLNLNIDLIKPDVYIEQDPANRWVSTKLDTSSGEKKKKTIDVDVDSINLRDANLVLAARRDDGDLNPPVKAKLDRVKANFLTRNQVDVIAFAVDGNLVNGGKIEVKGEGFPDTDLITLSILGDRLQALDVSNLLALPLEFSQGTVGGNLSVQLPKDSPALFQGTATLNNVNAQIAKLIQPFTQGNGTLRFQGTKIGFDNVKTFFGQVSGVINGVIDTEKDYQLAVKTNPLQIDRVIQTLKLEKPDFPLLGEVESVIQITGLLDRPQVKFDLVTTDGGKIDRVKFKNIRTNLELIDSTLFVRDFQGIPNFGGMITAKGAIDLKEKKDLLVDVQGINLSGNQLASIYQTKLPVDVTSISGKARFTGKTDALDNLRTSQGNASFALGGGRVNFSDLKYAAGLWQTKMQTSNVKLTSLPIDREAADTIGKGFLDSVFQLSGKIQEIELDKIDATGIAQVKIGDGTVTSKSLNLKQGNWQGNFAAREIKLKKIFAEVPEQLNNPVTGDFFLNGTTANLDLNGISGQGSASLAVLGGTVNAQNIKIVNGDYTTTLIPQNINLQQLAAIPGLMTGELNATGKLENFSPTAIQAQGKVNFSQGINAIDRPLTTVINWNGKRLNILNATASGVVGNGFLDVDESFFEDIPDKLTAVTKWQLNIPQGMGINVRNLSISLPDWAAQTDYTGTIDFTGTIAGTPKKPEVKGDVILNDFVVNNLAFEPTLRGKVDIDRIKGTNLQVSGVGNCPSDTKCETADRIQLQLDRDNQPISFLVQRDLISAKGSRLGKAIQIDAENFPVTWLKDFAIQNKFSIPETIAAQPLAGELSGKFTFRDDLDIKGENIDIIQPVFGRIKGDRVTGNFQYKDGYFALSNSKFFQGESEYRLDAKVIETQKGPELLAEAKVVKGEVQDVLKALQFFELADFSLGFQPRNYAKSKDLYRSTNCLPSTPECPLFSASMPQASIIDRLRRLSELQALLRAQEKKRKESSILPQLSALRGNFAGKIVVSGAIDSDLKANFQFAGKKWQWDNFTADEFKAEGTFADGILTLVPVSVRSDNSVIAFSGSFGGETQSGQVKLIDVPVELIQNFVKLPPAIGFGGSINGTAAIAGSKDNPQAKGEVTVANATIDQTSIQSTQGSFSYNNSRLDFFASSIIADRAEPLTIIGSLPYKFPFATVEPNNDKLSLSLNVRDRGLKLLNILSRGEINWIEGKGNVSLDIFGIFDRKELSPRKLVTQGVANIDQAKIAVRSLPEAPLTNVNGNILFNFDRIQVGNLEGNFGGGNVSVAGDIPLGKPVLQNNPLTVNLDDLSVKLKGLYQGGIQGQLQITGSAIEPDISGKLTLSQGSLLLGETSEKNQSNANKSLNKNNGGLMNVTEFNQLKIELADNIQISKPPILNFLATGSLKLYGSFNQPRPEGTIELKRGQVNLFTTQLHLGGNNKNTARFSKNNGLDPFLNVNLVGSSLETDRSNVLVEPSSSEINEPTISNLGQLQTVRIQAKVKGLASQLTNSIQLSSSPPRSQTEIIGLLGGSFVNTLGRGDSTLGLANLAGSALFGTFNTAISDALGLSEFRLFPTQIIDEKKERNSILGLAAEASVDLSKNISVSVLGILNSGVPAQYGLRYKLNDNFLLRGSSNFDLDHRVILEYENRF